jgi:hypothetical protein
VLTVDVTVGVGFGCEITVNARGVMVGVGEGVVLLPQAERIISSKLIPIHFTYLPGGRQKERFTFRQRSKERRQMSAMPDDTAMTVRVDIPVIVLYLSFQVVIMLKLSDLNVENEAVASR